MNLIERVEYVLEQGNFDYCRYSGCFDFAAKKGFTMFLKVLENIDSFQESQATNLKIISRNFDAAVALIGTHTRRESLTDSVMYERFDVPTFTPATLENIIINDMFPMFYRQRGGIFAEIDPQKLREGRKRSGLSQQQLAGRVGVTKKSIYEHEAGRKKAKLQVVQKMEHILGRITDPIVIYFEYSETNRPKDAFEKIVTIDMKRIGLDTDNVYQTPFNILARTENILLVSAAEENERRLKREAAHMSDLSEITNVPALAVTKKEFSLDIPSVTETDLREMALKDLRKKLS